MAKKRKLATSPFTLWLISWIAPAYLWLVRITSRWEHIDRHKYTSIIGSDKPFILAFWHNRILLMPFVKKEMGRDIQMLVSENKDGDYITQAVRRFGISFVRGSTANPRKLEKKKSGAAAMKSMIHALKNGKNVGITPDGPLGPRQRCHLGVVQIARLTGAPVVPVTWSTSRGKRFNSWDRFLLAAPFSKGYYVYGDPIYIEGKSAEEIEQSRSAIEESMNNLVAKADKLAGRTILPAAEIATSE